MKVVLDPQEIRELCAEFARRCSSRAMATKTKTAKMNAKRRPANTAGMVLAHNHVAHDQGTPVGVNGFRAFFFHRRDLPHFVVCPCGWRRDLGKHYAAKDHVKGYDPPRKRAKGFREYAEHNAGILELFESARRSQEGWRMSREGWRPK